MLAAAKTMGGNLLQRNFDHDLLQQTVVDPWLDCLTTIYAKIRFSFRIAGGSFLAGD
jgi:hypothetical protein